MAEKLFIVLLLIHQVHIRCGENFDTFVRSALAYEKLEQYDEALAKYKQAVEAGPLHKNVSIVYHKIGTILIEKKGAVKESIAYLEKSYSLDQSNGYLLQLLCHQYFKIGEFEKAAAFWKESWKNCTDEQLVTMVSSNLNGKIVLLTNADAGGWGDAFMWLRFAKELKKRGATVYYHLLARPALEPLLSLCPYIDKIIKKDDPVPNNAITIVTGNLMPIFCVSMEHIPADVPYLFARKDLIDYYKTMLNHDKNFKIGICWNPQIYQDASSGQPIVNARKMNLMSLYPLSQMNGVSFYSLQKIHGMDQLHNLPKNFIIHEFDPNIDTVHGRFMDTAAIMKNLDLVITVDTSIAHLAGALGVPVWIMLPFSADFR